MLSESVTLGRERKTAVINANLAFNNKGHDESPSHTLWLSSHWVSCWYIINTNNSVMAMLCENLVKIKYVHVDKEAKQL